MTEPLGFERMKALEIQERIDEPAAGGIAIVDGGQVHPERGSELRMRFDDAQKCLPNEIGVNIVMAKPLGQPMAHRMFKLVVIEDVREDKRGQLGLPACNVLRLGAEFDPTPGHRPRPLRTCLGVLWSTWSNGLRGAVEWSLS